MRTLHTRGIQAAMNYLDKKYNICYKDIFYDEDVWFNIVAILDGKLHFIQVNVRDDEFAAHDIMLKKCRPEIEREMYNWIKNYSDYEGPISFDVIDLWVMEDDRALLRHHINCLGD